MAKVLSRGRIVALATVLAIVLFVALNAIIAQLYPAQRADLTASRLFTLSEGSKTVLKNLDDTLRFRFFMSSDLVDSAPQLSAYATRVREMLEAYARLSEGKITLEVISPEPFSDDEDLAVGLGINQISVSGSPPLFFGMAATNSTDGRGSIPVFAPEREAYLEYDLTRLVSELGQRGKPKIALIDGLGLGANPMTRQPAQQILEQMRQFFDVQQVYGDVDKLADGTRLLMVVHPQNLSERTRFTIDQWVLGGGATMIFVDPHAETQPGPQPGMPAPNPRSDLPELFKAWGLGFDAGKAVGDRNYALGTRRVVGGREMDIPNLPWMALRGDALAGDDVVMSELSTILMTTAGALTSANDKLTLRPLLSATAQAGFIDAAQAGDQNADPRLLAADMAPAGGLPVMAARVEGKLSTAFASGRPEGAEAADGDAEVLTESSAPLNLMVFGDADMLMDRNWIQRRQILGQPVSQAFANNGDLVLNAIEQMAGGAVLAGLRGRGVFWRPFDRIEALQAKAQQQFMAKESELTERLKATEQRLRSASQEAGEGSELLSAERKQAVERFRADMLATRAELRDVQFNLNRDVDTLKRWITALNVGIWPLIVGIVVLFFALRRPKRELPVRA